MGDVIGAWLSLEEGQAFADYCEELGLDESALATVLLNRALSTGHLQGLKAQGQPLRIQQKRVTIRPRGSGLRSQFAELARQNGLAMESAVAMVLMAETREKWLRGAIAATPPGGAAEPN